MGVALCIGHCIACKRPISFNPIRVPSLVVNGTREPLCESCARRWGQIHNKPVTIHPDAYSACDESELGD